MKGERGRAYPHPLASLPFIIATGVGTTPLGMAATAAVLTHHSPLGKDLYRGLQDKPADYIEEKTLKALLQELSYLLNEYGIGKNLPVYEALKLIKACKYAPGLLLEQNFKFGEEVKTLRLMLKRIASSGICRHKNCSDAG